MLELICFIMAASLLLLTFVAALLWALRPYRKKSAFRPFYILTVGIFLSSAVAFFPLYMPLFEGDATSVFNSILSSAHNAIRMFVIDCDMEFALEQTAHMTPALRGSYRSLFDVLLVVAPILTVGVVLSFLEGISAYLHYVFSFFKDAYIFSELNERSLALAQSLKQAQPSAAIVFMDVFQKEDERSYEMLERAKKLDAICFKNDISVVSFRFHSKKKKLYFFVVGTDEIETMNQVIRLAAPYPLAVTECPHCKTHYRADRLIEEDAAEEGVTLPSLPLSLDAMNEYIKAHTLLCPTCKHAFPEKCELSPIRMQKKCVGLHSGYDYPRGDTRLFLFSPNFSSEQNLSALSTTYLKVRRVNDVQSLIYEILYKHGMDIFRSAKETGRTVDNSATGTADPEKEIGALIVGLGLHGTEMVKALSWFGQMHPYRLVINAIDGDEHAATRFRTAYPDLFDRDPVAEKKAIEEAEKEGREPVPPTYEKKPHNGDFDTPGEAHYEISIHSGIDATLSEFDDIVKRLTNTTYVLVSLGDDDLNIRIATKIRVLLRRLGVQPIIHTIVYNSNSFHALRCGRTASGESYGILPFGDVSSTYSEECVLNSALEKKALDRHMKYTNHVIEENGITGKERDAMIKEAEESFWKYDYNYRSSIASAIHAGFKVACGIPGSDKTVAERTEKEKVFIRVLEHKRWNAYVRSEGYVYAEKRDKLAKTHHLLVPFAELPYSEQIKDDD